MGNNDKVVILIGFIVSIFMYYSLRHVVNKKTDLNLPIFPERYYDDELKTIVQAALTMLSLLIGMSLTIVIASL